MLKKREPQILIKQASNSKNGSEKNIKYSSKDKVCCFESEKYKKRTSNSNSNSITTTTGAGWVDKSAGVVYKKLKQN